MHFRKNNNTETSPPYVRQWANRIRSRPDDLEKASICDYHFKPASLGNSNFRVQLQCLSNTLSYLPFKYLQMLRLLVRHTKQIEMNISSRSVSKSSIWKSPSSGLQLCPPT